MVVTFFLGGPVSDDEGGNRSVLATLATYSLTQLLVLFRTLVLICFAHTTLGGGDQRVQTPERSLEWFRAIYKFMILISP